LGVKLPPVKHWNLNANLFTYLTDAEHVERIKRASAYQYLTDFVFHKISGGVNTEAQSLEGICARSR
jgi:hypothetical protein